MCVVLREIKVKRQNARHRCDHSTQHPSRWAWSIWWWAKKRGLELKICWQTDFVDFLFTQWWSRFGLARIPTRKEEFWEMKMEEQLKKIIIIKKNAPHTLHSGASSSMCSRLFSEIDWFIHPIFYLPFVVQQAGNWAFKKTLQPVRVAEVATVEQERHK